MRVMVLVKADPNTESGALPAKELLAAMVNYNEELVKAGVMLAAEGLQPSSKGTRVRFAGKTQTVIHGPFPNPTELVAGFWLWQVRSLDEAIDWLKRAPFGGGAEIEIRPIMEAEDLGDNLTPELREKEDRMREEIERRNAG